MISKMAIRLVAIAMMIAAVTALEPAERARLRNMRSRFQNIVHPSTAHAAASADALGSASATSSVAAPAEPSRYYGSRFSPAAARYQPAVTASSGASPAGSVASASGPSGSASAAAHTGYNRYAPRPQPAAFQPRHQFVHPDEDPFYEPEEDQYEPAPFQPKYKPVAFVHPPVPRVAPSRNALNNRVRFGNGGVSTSAAAGAGSAAAASASNGGFGGRQRAQASAAQTRAGPSAAAASTAGASAAKAAASSSVASPAHYDAHEVEHEHTNEHYSEPETVNEYNAKAGVYANDGSGLVTSSYVRNTESEENHEDGKEDSDHYYNAGSYGKTYDENHSESYDNDDEDVLSTPTVFRSKKSSTKYQKDASKQRRESGSRVLATDKHSASYNKDNKKFRENVDKHFHKEGEGVLESGQSSEASDFDEESEEATDNRNLGHFVGLDGVRHARRPIFNPAAAAAASASSAGVSSSSSAGRR